MVLTIQAKTVLIIKQHGQLSPCCRTALETMTELFMYYWDRHSCCCDSSFSDSSLREAGRLVTSSVAQLDPLLQANQVIWYLEAPGAPFSFLEPKGRFSKGFQHLRVTWPPGCPCCVAEPEYLCAMVGLPWWAPRYLQSTQEKCEHVGDGVRVNASKSFSNVKHEDFKPMLIFTEPCRFKNAPC